MQGVIVFIITLPKEPAALGLYPVFSFFYTKSVLLFTHREWIHRFRQGYYHVGEFIEFNWSSNSAISQSSNLLLQRTSELETMKGILNESIPQAVATEFFPPTSPQKRNDK